MELDNNFNCSIYGRRATPKRHRRDIIIEGEYVNMTDIANRLGLTRSTARDRLIKARLKCDVVTWDSLKRNLG